MAAAPLLLDGLGVAVAVYTPVRPIVDDWSDASEDALVTWLVVIGWPGTPAVTLELGKLTDSSSW